MGTHTEAMDPPLLPCPFCGEQGCVVLGDRTYYCAGRAAPLIKWVVNCDGCGAEVLGMGWVDAEEGAPGFATAAEAVAAWNLRGGKQGGRLDG